VKIWLMTGHLGGMDRPSAAEPKTAKGIRRLSQKIEIPKVGGDKA
jgi:hypothetical protein